MISLNDIAWAGLEFIVNCFELLFLLLVPTFQIKKLRAGVRKWHITIFIIIGATLLLVYNYLTANSLSSTIWLIFVVILYVFLFTEGKWYVKSFWIIFPYSLTFCIDRFVIDLIMDIYHLALTDIASQGQYRLMAIAIAKSIEAVILVFSYRYRLEITREAKIFIIPLLMSWIIPTYLILTRQSIWMMTGVLLIINFGYLGYIHIQMENARGEKKTIQLKEQNALESAILHEHMHQYQGDVKNKIKVIWELMKTNNPTDNWIIFDELYHVNMNLKRLYDTGNRDLDITLSMKETIIKEKGITFRADIEKPLPYSIKHINISGLVFQLIDFIIAAIERIPTGNIINRRINLAIKTEDEQCIIEVKNLCKYDISSVDHFLSCDDEDPLFTKVKKMVNDYSGTLKTDKKDGQFTVFIQLPI